MGDLNEHLSNHLVDCFLAEAVSADDSARVRSHVELCSACAGKLAAARSEREAFLVRNPPAARVAQLAAAKRPVRWPFFAVPALALAAALALVLAPSLRGGDRPDVLVKGTGAAFLVRTAGQLRAAQASETLHQGDLVQPRLPVADAPYFALLALGADGKVQLLCESRPESPAQLPSLTLDAAPEPERLFLAWSRRAFDSQLLRTALGGDPVKVEKLPLGERLDIEVATLLVLKAR